MNNVFVPRIARKAIAVGALSLLAGLNPLTSPEAQAQAYACDGRADLWFLNDESGSVNTTEWNYSKAFLQNVAADFDFDSATGFQGSLWAWSNNTVTRISPSNDSYPSVVSSYTREGSGSTYPGVAMQAVAADIVNNTENPIGSGTTVDGKRIGTPQIAVLLTDADGDNSVTGHGGGIRDGSLLVSSANSIRAAGGEVVVFVIAEAAERYDPASPDHEPSFTTLMNNTAGGAANVIVGDTYADIALDPIYVDELTSRICAVAESLAPDDPAIEGLLTSELTDDTGTTGLSAGDTLTYTVVIENTGNVTLSDVGIDSNALTRITGGAAVPLDPAAFTTSDPTTLAPGEIATFTVDYLVTQDDINAGGLDHTATVIGTPPAGADVTDVTDDDTPGSDGADSGTGTEDDPARDAVTTAPEILVRKIVDESAMADGIDAGDVLIYTITVENTGNVTLFDLSLKDVFVDGAGTPLVLDSFESAAVGELAGTPNTDGSRTYETGQDLGVGETLSYSAEYALTTEAIASGGVSNLVTATGSTFDSTEIRADSSTDGNSSVDGDGAPTGTGFPGAITGMVRNYLAGEEGIRVRLLDDATGDLVATTITDSAGTYRFPDLAPGVYAVEFVNPVAGGIIPIATSGDYPETANRISGIRVQSGTVEVEQNAHLVDPSGVVYDSQTFAPISNATVTLLFGGSPVPNSWLDGSMGDLNGAVTGADGMYSFFLDPSVAQDGVYTIQVSHPDYVFESAAIPASSGPYTPGLGGGVEEISSNAVPVAGMITTYFLAFDFVFDASNTAATSNGVVRNHVPLDRSLVTSIEQDLLTVLEDDLAATMTQQSRQMERYASGALQRLRSRTGNQCRAAVAGVLEDKNILFDTDKAIIKPESEPVLDEIAGILATCQGARFEIAGHTDSDASDDYNQRLSQARVDAVLAAIAARNVSTAGFVATGYGESRPIATNATEAGKAQNRRVEFLLIGETTHQARECNDSSQSTGGFEINGNSGNLDGSGDYRREDRNCATDSWTILDATASFFQADAGVDQTMANLSYRRERFVNDDRVRGHFFGLYHARNNVSGLADGDITGNGVNAGIYGADRYQNGLYLDYYVGGATGKHDFNLDFDRPAGTVNADGDYTYFAVFVGAAVSGDTQIGQVAVSPRGGVDAAYSPGGDVDVNVAQQGLSQSDSLDLNSVNGGRIFGEVRFETLTSQDDIAFGITPRVACTQSIGSVASGCGIGGTLDLVGFNQSNGASYAVRLDGDRADSFTYGALSFNVRLPVLGGVFTANADVTSSGSLSVGQAFNLEF